MRSPMTPRRQTNSTSWTSPLATPSSPRTSNEHLSILSSVLTFYYQTVKWYHLFLLLWFSRNSIFSVNVGLLNKVKVNSSHHVCSFSSSRRMTTSRCSTRARRLVSALSISAAATMLTTFKVLYSRTLSLRFQTYVNGFPTRVWKESPLKSNIKMNEPNVVKQH